MIDRGRFVSTAASPALAAIAGAFGPAFKALAASEAPIDLGPRLEQIRERFGLSFGARRSAGPPAGLTGRATLN
jgi:hypothetical protein